VTAGRVRAARVRAGRALTVAVAVALTLSACTSADSSGPDAERSRAADDTTTATTVAGTATCPQLDRAEPREDGLPDLELPCLGDGPSVRLSDLRGVPTVLNVWAAWCTNCDREMPLFADAEQRAGDKLRFLGIHYKASRADALQSEDRFGVPFASVHDEDGDRVASALRVVGPPQTFFITADGRVAGREVGEITSPKMFDRLVDRYLGVEL
jgi:cytochrome c biogenesis protein CcmG/thiol:disulfide interchange protein DsbE